MKAKSIVTRLVAAAFSIMILTVSCQKNIDSNSKSGNSAVTAQTAAHVAGLQAMLLAADVQQLILTVYPNSKDAQQILTSGSCPPTITYVPDQLTYPRTATVDCGTGCTN